MKRTYPGEVLQRYKQFHVLRDGESIGKVTNCNKLKQECSKDAIGWRPSLLVTRSYERSKGVVPRKLGCSKLGPLVRRSPVPGTGEEVPPKRL